jgi:hypothetical protein
MKRLTFLLALMFSIALFSCDNDGQQAKSDSGVSKATVKVEVGPDGLSADQRNYQGRVIEDNKPGSIKHLYIISATTAEVIEYSTVRQKVTSGGKRISPTTVIGNATNIVSAYNNYVTLGGVQYTTNEFPDEYGTYGSSSDYLYWFDAQGNYHQYYPSGGTMLRISSVPLRVNKQRLIMELVDSKTPAITDSAR